MLLIRDLLWVSSLRSGQGRGRKPLCVVDSRGQGTCAQLITVWFPVHRSDVCAVAVLRCHGLELELLVDPRPLGFPLPDTGKHPLLAARGLPLRPCLSAGHPRLSDPAAVRPGRRHNSEWQHGRCVPPPGTGCRDLHHPKRHGWCGSLISELSSPSSPITAVAIRAVSTLGGLQASLLPCSG